MAIDYQAERQRMAASIRWITACAADLQDDPTITEFNALLDRVVAWCDGEDSIRIGVRDGQIVAIDAETDKVVTVYGDVQS